VSTTLYATLYLLSNTPPSSLQEAVGPLALLQRKFFLTSSCALSYMTCVYASVDVYAREIVTHGERDNYRRRKWRQNIRESREICVELRGEDALCDLAGAV